MYTKTSMIIYNSNVKHVCNSGTTLQNSGKGKENDRASVILHTIRCRGYRMCMENWKNGWREVKE
jgi:hypothetical protein